MSRPGHPSSCRDDTCTLTYREHLLSIGISATALPTRRRSVAGIEAREKRWERDMPAYRRLRADGIQPPGIDGAREMEQRAEVAEQIETARTRKDRSGETHTHFIARPEAFKAFESEFGHKPTEIVS